MRDLYLGLRHFFADQRSYIPTLAEARANVVKSFEKRRIDCWALQEEFEAAVGDDNFDWLSLECYFVPEEFIHLYSNAELRDYAQFLLFEVLYPEQFTSLKDYILALKATAAKIIKEYIETNNQWIARAELYKQIKLLPTYKDMPPFYMHYVLFANDSPCRVAKYDSQDPLKIKSVLGSSDSFLGDKRRIEGPPKRRKNPRRAGKRAIITSRREWRNKINRDKQEGQYKK